PSSTPFPYTDALPISRSGSAARRAGPSNRDRPGGRLRPRRDRRARARDAARLRGRAVKFSPEYLRHVVERLEGIGSHPLGFRVAGTPEEREAVDFIADEMRSLGLEHVTKEPVPVDAWR